MTTLHDDAALHAMLDSLSAAPVPTPAPRRPPTGHARKQTANSGAVGGDPLDDLIASANAQLASSAYAHRVPSLANGSAAAAHAALRVALESVCALARSRDANVVLRAEADARAKEAIEQEAEAAADVKKAQRRAAAAEREVEVLNAKVAEGNRREREANAKAERIVAEVRGRLAAVSRREAALAVDGKRRERDFGRLQEKVHTLLASRGATGSIQVDVVPWYSATQENGEDAAYSCDAEVGYKHVVCDAYEERQGVLIAENADFRKLLRAIQEELDDLVLIRIPALQSTASPSSSPSAPSRDATNGDAMSSVSSNDLPLEAPTVEQMDLPFEMVRDEFESSLEHKFRILRTNLLGEN
jgi:hypothetical protein